MMRAWPLRWKVGLAAVVFVAVGSMAVALSDWAKDIRNGAPKRARSYLQRFDGARAVLPRGVRVGYVTDVPTEQVWADEGTALLFHSAQCGVAPALLVNTSDAEWLLGNFHSRETMDRALKERQYSVVFNGRNGVVVLRRPAP